MNKVFYFLNEFLKKDDSIVIGVSGGPDSMALLDVLNNYKSSLNIKIIVAFVDHSTREEIDDERKLVKEYCKTNNLVFEETKILKKIDKNFEMEARKFRYSFFEQVIHKYNANYLFTAHHGDDLMETVIMRISRGSVLKGYKGINLVTDKDNYKIVRPLLYTDKDGIMKYLEDNNIKYMIDKTNLEDDHTRNKIRHNVLPYLKEEYKDVSSKFFQFYKELDMYDNFIDKYIDNSNILVNNKIDLEKYNKEDILIKTKVVERLLNDIYDGYLEIISKVHVIDIMNFIDNNKVYKKLTLPDSYYGIITDKYFELVKEIDFTKYVDIDYILDKDIILDDREFIYNVDTDIKSNYVIRLLSDEVRLPLHIRTRKDGDKIAVKNLNGTKKVSDILTDEKIELIDRENILLLCDDNDNILWVPGIKKSKFDKDKSEKYDIIVKYILKRGEKDE